MSQRLKEVAEGLHVEYFLLNTAVTFRNEVTNEHFAADLQCAAFNYVAKSRQLLFVRKRCR